MYDTILVPTDGSSDARQGAEHAVGLASALGATVHALYVIEEGTNPWSSASLDDQLDEARAYGEELTGEVADMAADAGVDCVTATKVGPHVHDEINKYVEEEDIDAIVMGSGFRGSMGDVLGSTADKVLRTAMVPVTVLRRGETN
ncbi:MAG: universal stress protein [Halobacteriales archaeon]